MAYCSNCGNFLEEGSNFCDQCGKQVKQQENSGYTQGYSYNPPKKARISDAIISMVFAILALEMSLTCWIPFFCFPFTALCIVFICVAKSKRNSYLEAAIEDNGFTKTAAICSTIAIPLTAFLGFIGFVISITA